MQVEMLKTNGRADTLLLEALELIYPEIKPYGVKSIGEVARRIGNPRRRNLGPMQKA